MSISNKKRLSLHDLKSIVSSIYLTLIFLSDIFSTLTSSLHPLIQAVELNKKAHLRSASECVVIEYVWWFNSIRCGT